MERPTRHSALYQVTRFECMRCLDTALLLKEGELFDCPSCREKNFPHKVRIAHLETAVLQRKPNSFSERDFDCARALVLTTPERPLKLATLCRFLACGEGQAISSINALRHVWKLPISKPTEAPLTYYWI